MTMGFCCCIHSGKGTSARDGAALAGALLEELDRRRCLGVFATHLHEIFDLPLLLRGVTLSRMGIDMDDQGMHAWHAIIPPSVFFFF